MRVGELITALKQFQKDRLIVVGLPEMDFSNLAYSLVDTQVQFGEDGQKRKCLLITVRKPKLGDSNGESKGG